MKATIEELREKWTEALIEEKASSERDWTFINLVEEFLDDLEDLG